VIPVTETFLFSLLTGTFVGLATGYIGSLMVLKKMALVGDALSHVALPGLALGLLFNFDPFLGAFAFLFLAAVVTWHLERNSKLSAETIVGVLFVLALAVGILITPEPELLEALFGDITKVGLIDTVLTAVISILAIFTTKIIYKKIILGIISEELAISSGIKVSRINLLYLLLVALIVAVGIKSIGTLLVGVLVIIPAASAKNISSNLFRYSLLSSLFGVISSFFGVLLSSYVELPAGPLVVLLGTSIFVISLFVNKILS